MEHTDTYSDSGEIIRTWRCCQQETAQVDTVGNDAKNLDRLRRYAPSCGLCGAAGESIAESESDLISHQVLRATARDARVKAALARTLSHDPLP